jgi:hypothetical protein
MHAMKTQSIFLLAVLVLLTDGCGSSTITSAVADDSTNDTWRLNEMAQRDPKDAEFVRSVKTFYQALEKQDWPTSYDMRVTEFKQDVTRDYYLKRMAEEGRSWRLNSYKVLNIGMFAGPTGDSQAAEIIMQFNEGGSVSYSCARWKQRFGKWLCDEPGLSGMLTSTRMPDWIVN